MSGEALGLIAGSGRLPILFATGARAAGHPVHAVAHLGETDAALAREVDSIAWVKLGQPDAILKALKARGVRRAVMAGGIGRVRALTRARPDAGMLRIAASLRSLRDDELLRAVAGYFLKGGVEIVAPTDYLREVVAAEGLLAGPALSPAQEADLRLGREVAERLGRADVPDGGGEGRGECWRWSDRGHRRGDSPGGAAGRAGRGGGEARQAGADPRFDLPAAGRDAGGDAGGRRERAHGRAGRTVLLDAALLFKWAGMLGISVVGMRAATSPADAFILLTRRAQMESLPCRRPRMRLSHLSMPRLTSTVRAGPTARKAGPPGWLRAGLRGRALPGGAVLDAVLDLDTHPTAERSSRRSRNARPHLARRSSVPSTAWSKPACSTEPATPAGACADRAPRSTTTWCACAAS